MSNNAYREEYGRDVPSTVTIAFLKPKNVGYDI